MKKKDEKTPAPKPRAEVSMLKAMQEGDLRRQEFLASLHPRQREALDPA